MNKKLLISTALASVALTGSALAELKVSANTEVTLRSLSYDTTSNDTGGVAGTVLGQETNIVISGGKDLDNGMTLSMGGNLELDNQNTTAAGTSDTMREVSMVASNDSMFIGYGRDHGVGVDLDGSVAPHVGDQNDTLAQGSTAFSSAYLDVHAGDHLKLGFNVLGGKLAAYYSPDQGSLGNDSGVPTGGPSAYQIGYQGNLGVEGLAVQLGYGASDDVKTATSGEKTFSKMGISYNFGQFAIGGDIQDFDYDITDTAASKYDGSKGETATRMNATFAASDNLAIGVSYTETEESLGTGTTGYLTQVKEEITAVTVGYNIAGMGFNLSYAETENLGGANNVDTTGWQIQTKQSF
jgi:hypothetical protein